MGDYGFRISTSGQDVKTCSDLDTLVNSKYAILKGAISGTASIAIPAYETAHHTITIAHNLGFIPMALVYFQDLDASYGYHYLPFGCSYVLESLDTEMWAGADSTNLYIYLATSANDNSTARTFYFTYHIFKDKGNLW